MMPIFAFFFALLLVVSWLLPIHFDPWLTAYPEILAAFALCVALWGLLLAPKHSLQLPKSSLAILLIALVPLAQWMTGTVVFGADAWLSAGFIAILVGSLWLGFNLQALSIHSASTLPTSIPPTQQTHNYAVGFAWFLIIAALISCFLALLQWLKSDGSLWLLALNPKFRPSANLGQPNNLATLLGFGLAAVLYLFEKRMISAFIASSITLAIFAGLVFTQSRTPWVTALFIVGFWMYQSRHIHFRLSVKQLLLWVLVFVALSVLLPMLVSDLDNNSIIERGYNSSARLELYTQGLIAVKHGPWLGYGWNQFLSAQLAVANVFPSRLVSLYSHNALLDLLIWNGPIIGSLIILAAAYLLTKLLRTSKSVDSSVIWVGLSFFLMHSMLEFPHAYSFFLVPAGILLGALMASTSPIQNAWPLNKMALLVFTSVLTVGTVWTWHDYTVVEENYRAAIALLPGQKANPESIEQLKNIRLIDNMSAYSLLITMPLDGDYNDDEIQQIIKTVKRYPYSYSLTKSAYILARHNQVDLAYDYLIMLAKLHGSERLEKVLSYFASQQEQHPELALLLNKFGLE